MVMVYGYVLAAFITVILGLLGGDWVRHRGKSIESGLFKEWEGNPAARMLSYAHSQIHRDTLKQCHAKCVEFLPDIVLPGSLAEEQKNQAGSMELYRQCVSVLLEKTRGHTLLLEENIRYGTRRNLYAVKGWGVFTSIASSLAIGGKIAYVAVANSSLDNTAVVFLVICLILLVAWIFMIKKSWVREQANTYARQLILAAQA